MAVGKVRRRRIQHSVRCAKYRFSEQAPIERQEGYQEKGRRPLLPQGYDSANKPASNECLNRFYCRLVRHQGPIDLRRPQCRQNLYQQIAGTEYA